MSEDVEQVLSALTEAQRRLIAVSDSPATAKMLAERHGQMSGHGVGHFARRSYLFERAGRAEHWVAIWRLTPLGLAVRALLSGGES